MKKEEVKLLLESWLDGSLDSNDWDCFISVKLKTPELESIRMESQGIWVHGSTYLELGAIDPCQLSELGRTKVFELLKQVS